MTTTTTTTILDTYYDVTCGQSNLPVAISTLRAALPGIPAAELNTALVELMSTPGVILYPEDNPMARTPKLEAGALSLAGGLVVKHWVKLEG